MGLTPAPDYWSTRHETFGAGWCERYWNSWTAPHRLAILDIIRKLEPRSLTEVGCHVGANLRLIRSEIPGVALTGYDLNQVAVAYGQARMPDVTFHVDNLATLEPAPADVILSCYALAYVDPAEIAGVLGRLKRAARKALILAEPTPPPEGLVPGLDYEEWRHDYDRYLSGVSKISIPSVDRLSEVMVVIALT